MVSERKEHWLEFYTISPPQCLHLLLSTKKIVTSAKDLPRLSCLWEASDPGCIIWLHWMSSSTRVLEPTSWGLTASIIVARLRTPRQLFLCLRLGFQRLPRSQLGHTILRGPHLTSGEVALGCPPLLWSHPSFPQYPARSSYASDNPWAIALSFRCVLWSGIGILSSSASSPDLVASFEAISGFIFLNWWFRSLYDFLDELWMQSLMRLADTDIIYTLVTILCVVMLFLYDTRTIHHYSDHTLCYSLDLEIVLSAYFS